MILRLILLSMFLVQPVMAETCSELLNFNFRTLNEKDTVNLCERYQGKVLLIVNTASRCAYTDQYDDLEKLYRRYKQQGLVVLGFPSNDFGQQEPGTEEEIKSFCRLTYGVEFPMFEKTSVTKNNAHGFYRSLAQASGRYPMWNFHKYLIDRKGHFVTDYMSAITPHHPDIINQIEKLLNNQ